MTNAQSTAYKIRWLLVAAGLLCWGAGALYLLNPIWPKWEIHSPGVTAPETGVGLLGVMGLWIDDRAYCFWVCGYLGFFLITQRLFLAPRRNWRIQVNEVGRPMTLSVVIAGLMSAMLTVGLLATILELCGGWRTFSSHSGVNAPRYWPPLCALAIAWVAWAAVFFIFWRQGDRLTRMGRIIRGLIAGSILETLVAAGAEVWIRNCVLEDPLDKECYCARGSYTGLVFGGTVLLWAFGPGVALLFLREKNRREKLIKGGSTDTELPG